MIRRDVGPNELLVLFGFVFTIRETRVGLKTEKELGMTESCVVEKDFQNLNLRFHLVLAVRRDNDRALWQTTRDCLQMDGSSRITCLAQGLALPDLDSQELPPIHRAFQVMRGSSSTVGHGVGKPGLKPQPGSSLEQQV